MISCRAFADIAISASLSTPGYAGVLRSTICLVDALELSQKFVVYEDFAGLPRSFFFLSQGTRFISVTLRSSQRWASFGFLG